MVEIPVRFADKIRSHLQVPTELEMVLQDRDLLHQSADMTSRDILKRCEKHALQQKASMNQLRGGYGAPPGPQQGMPMMRPGPGYPNLPPSSSGFQPHPPPPQPPSMAAQQQHQQQHPRNYGSPELDGGLGYPPITSRN